LRRLWLPAHVIRQRIGTVLTGRWSKERDFQASGSFTFGSTDKNLRRPPFQWSFGSTVCQNSVHFFLREKGTPFCFGKKWAEFCHASVKV